MIVACPGCGNKQGVSWEAAGSETVCPRCRKVYIIPELPPADPNAPPPLPGMPRNDILLEAGPDVRPAAVATAAPPAPGIDRPCPNCLFPMPAEMVVCPDCGFDIRGGSKLAIALMRQRLAVAQRQTVELNKKVPRFIRWPVRVSRFCTKLLLLVGYKKAGIILASLGGWMLIRGGICSAIPLICVGTALLVVGLVRKDDDHLKLRRRINSR